MASIHHGGAAIPSDLVVTLTDADGSMKTLTIPQMTLGSGCVPTADGKGPKTIANGGRTFPAVGG